MGSGRGGGADQKKSVFRLTSPYQGSGTRYRSGAE